MWVYSARQSSHMCVLSLVCSDLNAKICRKAQPGSSVITKQLANHSKRADEHSSWSFERGVAGSQYCLTCSFERLLPNPPEVCDTPKIKRDREESLTLTSIKTRKRRASWTGSQPVDLQQCTDVDWEQKVLITSTNKSSILDVSLPSQKLIGKLQIVDRTEKIPKYSGDSWRLLGKIRRIQM